MKETREISLDKIRDHLFCHVVEINMLSVREKKKKKTEGKETKMIGEEIKWLWYQFQCGRRAISYTTK